VFQLFFEKIEICVIFEKQKKVFFLFVVCRKRKTSKMVKAESVSIFSSYYKTREDLSTMFKNDENTFFEAKQNKQENSIIICFCFIFLTWPVPSWLRLCTPPLSSCSSRQPLTKAQRRSYSAARPGRSATSSHQKVALLVFRERAIRRLAKGGPNSAFEKMFLFGGELQFVEKVEVLKYPPTQVFSFQICGAFEKKK
jgi:hypothetical protein